MRVPLPLILFLLIAAHAFADSTETVPLLAYLQPDPDLQAPAIHPSANAIVWVHLVRDSANRIVSGSLEYHVTLRSPAPASVASVTIADALAQVPDIQIAAGISASTKPALTAQLTFPSAGGGVSLAAIERLVTEPENFAIRFSMPGYPDLSAPLAAAQMTVLMALLSPLDENPPARDSAASAVVSFLVLRGQDPSGSFTTAAIIFDAAYQGFPSGTRFTGFHIHSGAPGSNGPVILNTGIEPGTNSLPASASGSGTLRYTVFVNPDDAPAAQAEVQAIDTVTFFSPNAYYADIHTVSHPSGEIRAQVRTTDHMDFQIDAPRAEISIFTLRNPDASVSAGAILFDVNYRGAPSDLAVTGLHLHSGTTGLKGPLVVDSGLSAVTQSGTVNLYGLANAVSNAALNSITQRPERFYCDVQTTALADGTVRSQLAAENTGAQRINAVAANPDVRLATLAPGEIFSIYGLNLGKYASDLSGFYLAPSLPVSLNGISVSVGGFPAPLYYVSALLINAQVPLNVPAGPQSVIVATPDGPGPAFTTTIAPAAPAIYTYTSAVNAVVVNSDDFSLIGPDDPARPGRVAILYLTGMGQTVPPLQAGDLHPDATLRYTNPVTVKIAGQNAPVAYSIASPGFPGLYQIAFTIPAGLSGILPMVVTAGGVTSNTAVIAIQ